MYQSERVAENPEVIDNFHGIDRSQQVISDVCSNTSLASIEGRGERDLN